MSNDYNPVTTEDFINHAKETQPSDKEIGQAILKFADAFLEKKVSKISATNSIKKTYHEMAKLLHVDKTTHLPKEVKDRLNSELSQITILKRSLNNVYSYVPKKEFVKCATKRFFPSVLQKDDNPENDVFMKMSNLYYIHKDPDGEIFDEMLYETNFRNNLDDHMFTLAHHGSIETEYRMHPTPNFVATNKEADSNEPDDDEDFDFLD